MSSKKIVYKGGGLTLLAGLDWRLLPATKKLDAAVREGASIKSASHYVVARAQSSESIDSGSKTRQVHRVTAGYVQTLGGAKELGKKPHSVAAAFAALSAEHYKAALYAVVTPEADDSSVVVVVVINGMPVLDSIVADRIEARSRLSGFLHDHPDMVVIANDQEQYPQDFYGDLWGTIAGSADKTTALKPVPVDYAKVMLVVLGLAVAYGGWHFWSLEQARQARIKLEQQAAQSDPANLYLGALAGVQSWGVDRQAFLAAFESIMPMPYQVGGWKGVEVVCDSVCRATFERVHGTFDMFNTGVAQLPLKVASNPTEITLSRIAATWPQELTPAALPESAKTATVDSFVSQDGSQFQDWMLAGLSLRIDAPSLYPEVAGVPRTFAHAQAVRRGAFEVAGIALPLVREVIETAPANVVFTGFKVSLSSDGQDALTQANTTVSGYYYVNQ